MGSQGPSTAELCPHVACTFLSPRAKLCQAAECMSHEGEATSARSIRVMSLEGEVMLVCCGWDWYAGLDSYLVSHSRRQLNYFEVPQKIFQFGSEV